MTKGRMEAFSDGVIAVIITILVLELRVPREASLAALRPVAPVFISYALSFVFLGIYWSNHHHMLQAVKHVDGRVLWAIYLVAIPLAFLRSWLACALYVLVAVMWLVPDRRIEKTIVQ